MSQFNFEVPRDPVELAMIGAERVSQNDMLEATPQEERMLVELDHAACELDMIGRRYYINAHRAFIIPKHWDDEKKVWHTQFYGLRLEGEFSTYARVAVGRLHGSPNTVRALCLTIRSALLIPCFDTVPEDELTYIPIFAVSDINPIH